MSPQGASARMEARILLYLQEHAKPALEREQQKTNQKEVAQDGVSPNDMQKEAEQKVALTVSSCRLFKVLSLLKSLSSVQVLVSLILRIPPVVQRRIESMLIALRERDLPPSRTFDS
jgi:hypothetical protein